MNFDQKYKLAFYGPMIYTAPYVMLLMRANPLRGQIGVGWAGGNRDFFGPSEMASSRQANGIRGPKKSRFLKLGQLKYSLQFFTSTESKINVINFAFFASFRI
jgi:hypothetical protein